MPPKKKINHRSKKLKHREQTRIRRFGPKLHEESCSSDHDFHGKVSTDLCTDIKLTVHESERETNVMQCLLPSYPHEQYKKK